MNETELLRRFVEENAQDAFAELVRDKINLVYATALRLVGGDSHLAQDVTQGVFLALACQAAKLMHHTILAGWLYTTTRFLAAKALRGQRRWQRRETEANAMDNTTDQTDTAWQELRPVIDDSLQELGGDDRTILLLRFFDGRSQSEVGKVLGITENAARMRIDRALEKLRTRLTRRGITSTAVAIGVALSGQPLIAAPVSLAPMVTSVALGAASAGVVTGLSGLTMTLLNFMNTTKLVLGAASAMILFGAGAFVGAHSPQLNVPAVEDHTTSETRTEIARLRKENGQLKEQLTQPNSPQSTKASAKGVAVGLGNQDILAVKRKWELLAELSKQKLFTSRVAFVDNGGTLNPAVVSLFDLTPEEQAALSRTIDTAREKIETLERANATITRQPDGKIDIEIKPFPALGGAVYDELTAGIAQTLGPERNAAFVTLCADQMETALGSFGAAERKVTVTSQPDSKHSRYLARDEQTAPGSRHNTSSNYRTREDLLNKVGTVTKLLPADF